MRGSDDPEAGHERPPAVPGAPDELLDPLPASRLSRRQRAWRGATAISVVLLALVVIASGSPLVRDWVGRIPTAIFGTPTEALPKGADHFYVVVAVPWATVTLDGRRVGRLPRIGADPPLVLARGRHVFTWQAAPFLSQHCTLSIPASLGGTCTIAAATILRSPSLESEQLVLLNESLATLSADMRAQLVTALQTATASYRDIVQPGEAYFLGSAGLVLQL